MPGYTGEREYRGYEKTMSYAEVLKVFTEDYKCIPARAHSTDAGMDLIASESVVLKHGIPTLVKCGIHLEIPEGHVGLIFPRSGLATKRKVTLANSVGVIDSGYRGEVMCSLIYTVDGCITSVRIDKYERIAQLVILPISLNNPIVVGSLGELSETERGVGGFGSTG